MCACDCKEPEDEEPTLAEGSNETSYSTTGYCQTIPTTGQSTTVTFGGTSAAAPCPTCGHCPTCGRSRWNGPYWNVYPYWQQPYVYPQTYWYTTGGVTTTGAGGGAVSYNNL